ncbi:hypothetical protein [Fluviispira sanaruensis]|uniref:Uncharacterized protein n=1 Tax=Fluviispira sanaruensis TaxID=2493639 RepID=A0A4V0P2W2_FLUSA|nr:hypothetical protein [Fluviispira sanaruensis]BBH54617.1 hypothetical protein JCM31447_30910 [Fluviispira sanaruensis]
MNESEELEYEYEFLSFCERQLKYFEQRAKLIEKKHYWELNTELEWDIFYDNEHEIDDVKERIMLSNERINKIRFNIPSIYYP